MTTVSRSPSTVAGAARSLLSGSHPIEQRDADYDSLIELVGDKRIVLIGEASHGTADFYRERARITRRLIDERGFLAVAVEADWPDAQRVNRYVMGQADGSGPGDGSAVEALADFRRFPGWMWRNTEVVDFVEWLRARNERQPSRSTKARFYGLDLYSLRASIEAVIDYLETVDPQQAELARQRYACFDHVGADGQAYGFSLARRGALPCENEVVAQLLDLRRRADQYARRDGATAEDALFSAEQNAVLVRDAEEYYQQMYRAEVSSWNLRDRHMAATLDALIGHLESQHGHAKVVVWEHNSHIGDARATGMATRGELNVGQLVRQRFGPSDCALIGMTTYDGTVTAASNWGEDSQRRVVRPALPNSHEALLHEVPLPAFWLATGRGEVREALTEPRLERAIGVIYRPETERASHYFTARLADQFDVVIHIDRTTALEPLERNEVWDRGEPAETYPSGI